jgi:TRAP-type transport system small permease protein
MSSIAQLFDRSLALLAATVLVALLTVVTSGIVSRAAGTPFIWTDEAASYLMVWLSMLGWMVATRRGVHIRVRSLFDLMPPVTQAWAERLFLLLLATLGIVVAWQGLHLVIANADVAAITFPLSLSWLYLPLIPAGFMMAGQACLDLAKLGRDGAALTINDRSAPL